MKNQLIVSVLLVKFIKHNQNYYLKLDVSTSIRGLHQKKLVHRSSNSWHNGKTQRQESGRMCGSVSQLIQGQSFSELECSLSSHMAQMSHFCGQWWLKPSASKTISSVFHLHNTSGTHELSVYLDGQCLQHECHPTYLGVTLDHTLFIEYTWRRLQANWRTETTCWWS